MLINRIKRTPQEAKDFGVNVPAQIPEYDILVLKKCSKSPKEGIKLVSIRSWDEYTGKNKWIHRHR